MCILNAVWIYVALELFNMGNKMKISVRKENRRQINVKRAYRHLYLEIPEPGGH